MLKLFKKFSSQFSETPINKVLNHTHDLSETRPLSRHVHITTLSWEDGVQESLERLRVGLGKSDITSTISSAINLALWLHENDADIQITYKGKAI